MMDAIDACSLVAFVRYYLPFDKDLKLFNFIRTKIESKEIIVIDKVYEECQNVAKGIVVKALPYLKDYQHKTSDYLPDKRFFNLTDNNFINTAVKNKLPSEQFEIVKRAFLEGTDAKLLLFCLNNTDLIQTPRIVTEETETSNDNKGFKKIPALSKILNIGTITLPQLLQEYGGFDSIISKDENP